MEDWPILSHYDAAHLREIAMPLGGVGTGFFALGGRGQLTDWQLMNRPHKGWKPLYSHLLLRTRQVTPRGEQVKLRILEGDIKEGLADIGGLGPVMAGIPRFKNATYEAAYPFGRVRLADPQTPVTVSVEGFNPLIPRDSDASSLPMALLTLTLANRTASALETSVTFLLSNFIGTDGMARDLKDNVTESAQVGDWKGMRFAKTRPARTPQNGTMAILCDVPDARVARRWPFQGKAWNGELLGVIDSLLGAGFLPDADPGSPCPPSPDDTWHSALSALFTLPARETRVVRFLVAWHFPYRNMAEDGWWSGDPGHDPLVENHYATRFKDALDVAQQVLPQLPDLRARTSAFVKSVVERSAPREMREAALCTLTALRSHTSFRLADGTFAGFEGCNPTSGCCHGSCTHVWNYSSSGELFPDLSRSMIESHLKFALTPGGGERFRLSLPVINQTWNGAAADGQMGLIVRCYEQYLMEKESGGTEWLKRWYPAIKRMVEFAWAPGGWDADRDGVMEGAQHNTYDVEFFGPNPLCTIWYLAALAAAAKMAQLAGDSAFAKTCEDLRAQGSAWVDRHLYNGRYYFQSEMPPPAHPAPMTSLTGEAGNPHPRFQVGKGCLIDQLAGQYKANRVGLGDLLDRLHIETALLSIFKYNYHPNFRDHYNNMRTFAAADESGTLICSYPDGGRPAIPFPYWAECMTGFEYQFAVLLLDYGFHREAFAVAKAVRDRHNGANRNPFNEPECGDFYARAMASWALLDAWK